MFGGYSRKLSQDWALATMQSVGLSHVMEEEEMFLDSESDTNRFSAAVTLKDGSVILTGGKNRLREVFHLSNLWGKQNWKSKRLADMERGRYGHASAVFLLEGAENVIAAGGCDGKGEVQDSVEMYSIKNDIWTMLQNLRTPRIYFALQVENVYKRKRKYNKSLQVKGNLVCAFGGYNTGVKREKEFPGDACTTWTVQGWTDWEEKEADGEKRSSFMSALVPMSWIEEQCTTEN